MISVKPGFVMARSVCRVTPVAVFSEMPSVLSVREECGTTEEDVSHAASVLSSSAKMISLSTRPVAKWLRLRI